MVDTNKAYLDGIGTLTADGQTVVEKGFVTMQMAVTINNHQKGWRSGDLEPQRRNFGELIALLHSEVSEALEAYRDGIPVSRVLYENPLDKADLVKSFISHGELAKPVGVASELADVIIRVLDMADEWDIPLVQALIEKHRFNQSRPARHGGKLC